MPVAKTACPRCDREHDPMLPCATETLAGGEAPRREPSVRVPSIDLPPGTVVGEYEVVRKIGAGAMGLVYEGVHPLIERKVAIKVLNHEVAASPDAGSRLILEARAANRVRHRNIVDVYSIGALPDGRLYLVMELLEGKSLQRLIDERGPLPFAEAMVIVEGALSALAAAHEAGVVHRDLKPENIFVMPGPDDSMMRAGVKILDFGVAHVGGLEPREGGGVVGTPAFMSPEQCRGDGAVDTRSDLYSFGIVLYFLFTARLPFDGDSYLDVIDLQLTARPAPPSTFFDVPASVEEVILRLLEKDPARRYPNAEAVRVVLKSCDAWGWSPRPRDAASAQPSAKDDDATRPFATGSHHATASTDVGEAAQEEGARAPASKAVDGPSPLEAFPTPPAIARDPSPEVPSLRQLAAAERKARHAARARVYLGVVMSLALVASLAGAVYSVVRARAAFAPKSDPAQSRIVVVPQRSVISPPPSSPPSTSTTPARAATAKAASPSRGVGLASRAPSPTAAAPPSPHAATVATKRSRHRRR